LKSAFHPSEEWVAKAKALLESRAGRPLSTEESDRLVRSLIGLFESMMRWAEEHPEIVSTDRSELGAGE
jgi:hypothetical protein